MHVICCVIALALVFALALVIKMPSTRTPGVPVAPGGLIRGPLGSGVSAGGHRRERNPARACPAPAPPTARRPG